MPKSDFWGKLKTRLIEVSNAAADFTEEQAVVGKLKFDILNLNRKIDRNKHEIGDIVVQISRSKEVTNPLDDGEIMKRLVMISELEAQIEFKRAEIARDVEEIRGRRHHASKPASEATTPSPKPAPSKPAAPARKPAATPVKKPAVKKPTAKPEPKA
jgi:hypothetical protein